MTVEAFREKSHGQLSPAKADPEPGPLAVLGTQLDPIQHTHLCPVCYRNVDCKEFCATEFGFGEELVGAPWECDACKNAPVESVDIITGKIEAGDLLRPDDDAFVYEVTDVDMDDLRAELNTVVGYPKNRRWMILAQDGSPARRRMADYKREPLWFRVRPS